jgi:hypothetical protein
MDRPLFAPPVNSAVEDTLSDDEPAAIPADALFGHVYVDRAKLAANIRRALQQRQQISLRELIEQHPLEQGLAEVVAYFSLATEDEDALIDDESKEAVVWVDAVTGLERRATMPLVVYSRASGRRAELG